MRPKDGHAVIVFVSVGNPDNKLTQHDWARLIRQVEGTLAWLSDGGDGQMLDAWFSRPDSWRQGACWRVAVADEAINHLKTTLIAVTKYVDFEWGCSSRGGPETGPQSAGPEG